MYQYDVYCKNERFGTAEVEREGLYWHVVVRCEMPEGIYRVFAQNVNSSQKLGVLSPEDGKMTLEKRISCSSFCFDTDTALTIGDAPWWQPVSQVDGFEISGARVHGNELLVPYEKDAPFACMPLFCFFRLVTRYGGPYWQMLLDADGKPQTA